MSWRTDQRFVQRRTVHPLEPLQDRKRMRMPGYALYLNTSMPNLRIVG